MSIGILGFKRSESADIPSFNPLMRSNKFMIVYGNLRAFSRHLLRRELKKEQYFNKQSAALTRLD